ncbi:hypothetical protein XELAEV_18045871mg [Xenopus laevis]|uniref:Uncharacterized protein n=1 Tax=Xenopus laevis TaxID=8355 RepID=A0A974H046_XENLA|nr:hypothetical protein XELAEV_18045871mg [Xenopus laevis]
MGSFFISPSTGSLPHSGCQPSNKEMLRFPFGNSHGPNLLSVQIHRQRIAELEVLAELTPLCREKRDFPVQMRDCGLSCQKRDCPSEKGTVGRMHFLPVTTPKMELCITNKEYHRKGEEDSNTGVSLTTDSNTGMSLPTDSNTGVSLPTDSNTGVSLTTDSNTGVSLTTDSNTGVSLTTDSNTGVSLTTDSNTGVSLTTDSTTGVSLTTDSNTGVSLTIDSNTGVSLTIDSNTGVSLTIDSNTGVSLTIDSGANIGVSGE